MTVYVNGIPTGGGNVPSGGNILWTGTIASIPAGYVIADGNNGSKNLLAKFVQGVATAATDPGATGGAVNYNTAGHQHASVANHQHTNPASGASGLNAQFLSTGPDTQRAGDHTHTQGDTGATGGHQHASVTDSIFGIRPPFYDVAYIMKT